MRNDKTAARRSYWNFDDVLPPTAKRPRTATTQITTEKESSVDARRLVKLAAGIWLASRVALFLLTYVVQVVISWRHHTGLVLPWDMITRWREFDAIDYTNIAVYGYNSLYRSAFFPLYPSYIALVNFLFLGRQPVLAALIVNNVGALIGSIGLAFLAVRESNRYDVAKWTLLALFAYPLAFFLAAPYSEGLFLASFAWCLWATRERIWWLAALMSFIAALTRLTGIVLVIPMLIEFLRTMEWGKRINFRDVQIRVISGILLLIAVPLGIGLFMLYLGKTIGDPLGFIHAQVYFGHSTLFYPVGLVEGIHFYLSRPFLSFTQIRQMIDFLPLIGLTAIAIIGARKQPLAYTVLVLELFVLATQSPKIVSPGNAVFVSAGRYMLMALPSFLIIGGWFARNPKLGLLCCGASFLVQIVFAVYFLQGGAII
jgi:Gpi18-like mannosyltransferase